MPANTPRLTIPYPEGTDVVDVPGDVQALAERLDDVAAWDDQGTLATRPVSTVGSPGIRGRYYFATDNGILYRDTGTDWVAVNPKDAAAGTASLRTLGAGATQAAPGNDARLSDQRTSPDNSVTTAQLQDASVTGLKMSSAMRGEWRLAGVIGGSPLFTLATGTTAYQQMLSSPMAVNSPPTPSGMVKHWKCCILGYTSIGGHQIHVRDVYRSGAVGALYVGIAGLFIRESDPVASDQYPATNNEAMTFTIFEVSQLNTAATTYIYQIQLKYKLAAL